MSVRILYGDVAPEAKENFVPDTEQALYPDKLTDLQVNAQFPQYQNPCEDYSIMLDGTAVLLPETITNERIGLVSEDISNADGSFTTPLVLTLEADGQYSSQGLTFTFDTANNIFPKSVNIVWYRGTTQLEEEDFTPDNAFFFCKKQVTYYDKVVITFDNLNMPYNRLRLKCIDYGYGTYLEAGELRNVKIIQQLNPISSQIEINTGDFVLDSLRDIPYNFQSKQPLSVFFNDNLQQVVFIKKATRKSERLWDIQAEDYISMLEGINFLGDIYTNYNAKTLVGDIFGRARVPYAIDSTYDSTISNLTVTGHIPICTCREALMQVLFAAGAVCDTSGVDVPTIFALPNTVSQHIPLERIRQGQKIIDDETITGVEVTAHAYKANSSTENTDLYRADDSGTGTNIFVQFSNPCHTLQITDGTIVESNANYAIINANTGCVLTGKEYEHTTSVKAKNNPVILASDIPKIASVENATLISSANIDNTLNRCYDYYINRANISMDIRQGKTAVVTPSKYGTFKYGTRKYGRTTTYADETPVAVGDKITADNGVFGTVKTVQGRIEKQTYSLFGNIIWKQCEVR